MTGNSAAEPGNEVVSSNITAPAMIAVSPKKPISVAVRPAGRCDFGSSAANPPAANSHARNGDPKNAHGCTVLVKRRLPSSDTAPTVPSSSISGARLRFARAIANPAAISSGHSR